ncbi:hypothetical protein V7794_30760 [Rhizobium laguerreae]
MRYAVVIAGLPGKISSSVKDTLQERFTDNHVFRAAGAPYYDDGSTVYDGQVIADTLRMGVDAVFGKSARPNGFCRNVDRPCALHYGNKDACGKLESETCFRLKPDFLIVIYQTGLNEEQLLTALHHSALTIRLPAACYAHLTKTVDACIEALKASYSVLGTVRRNFESAKNPLTLPVLNARTRELDSLLSLANKTGGKSESEQFKRTFFSRSSGSYKLRTPLEFQPSQLNGRHGIPDAKANDAIALSRIYRLGCQYLRDFHYDVHRNDDKHLSGNHAFHCREGEEDKYPKGRNANVTVDDCLPWET